MIKWEKVLQRVKEFHLLLESRVTVTADIQYQPVDFIK